MNDKIINVIQERIDKIIKSVVEVHSYYKESKEPELEDELKKLILFRFSEVLSKSKLLLHLFNEIEDSEDSVISIIQKNLKLGEAIQNTYNIKAAELLANIHRRSD